MSYLKTNRQKETSELNSLPTFLRFFFQQRNVAIEGEFNAEINKTLAILDLRYTLNHFKTQNLNPVFDNMILLATHSLVQIWMINSTSVNWTREELKHTCYVSFLLNTEVIETQRCMESGSMTTNNTITNTNEIHSHIFFCCALMG